MTITAPSVADACRAAREAGRAVGAADAATRSAALAAFATALERRADEILAANAADVAAAPPQRLALVRMSRARLGRVVDEVARIAGRPDPVGDVLETGPLGAVTATRVRVALGLVAFVVDGRPQLLPGAIATCLRAGNGVVVASSPDVARTARALASAAADGLAAAGLPAGAVAPVDGDAAALAALGRQAGVVDLIKQRGRDDATAAILRAADVPVILAIDGVCHVFVDASADHDVALDVVLESKLTRPGMCNALETLLVHGGVAPALLPPLVARLAARGVELRMDERARALAGSRPGTAVRAATADDWSEEYGDLVLAVAVVDGLDDAIAHIDRHGTGHAEAIVTRSAAAAERFQRQVDAAFVCVNAATSHADGRTLGRAGELGNSTQRLPARGPIGPAELCTTKVLVAGSPPAT